MPATDRMQIFTMTVPTFVPKPGVPTLNQGNLACPKTDTVRSLGSSQITPDCEIYSLKIRVSVGPPSRAEPTEVRRVRETNPFRGCYHLMQAVSGPRSVEQNPGWT